MNWMFSIIPLTDFDLECAPFLVAPTPRSHKLTQVIDKRTRIWDITRPDMTQLSSFIEPELKAGDLLLVNQHTWHKAPAGFSTQDPLWYLQQVLRGQCPSHCRVLSV